MKKRKLMIIIIIIFVFAGSAFAAYEYNESQKRSSQVLSKNNSNDKATVQTENTKVEDTKKDEEVKKEQETKKEKESQKETSSNTEGSKVDQNKQTTNNDGKVTQNKAVEIVGKYVNSKDQKAKVQFDHIQKRDNVDYYVIRAYEDMSDHIATLGWYYVDVNNGKAFEWDLIEDKLIPLK